MAAEVSADRVPRLHGESGGSGEPIKPSAGRLGKGVVFGWIAFHFSFLAARDSGRVIIFERSGPRFCANSPVMITRASDDHVVRMRPSRNLVAGWHVTLKAGMDALVAPPAC
jgi:hypothetical protein